MDQITVLIADDHVLFREGLAMLLGQQDDIRVSAKRRMAPKR